MKSGSCAGLPPPIVDPKKGLWPLLLLLSTYDWGTLRADEEFMFIAIGLLRNQLVAEESLIELRDQALSLCETLGIAIGAECNPW